MSVSKHTFISYQRTDEALARQVREHLVAHGISTWMDQYDIPAGAYWPDEIDAALVASQTVVGILSPDAVASRNVKNEWDWAIQNDKPLILLQAAPCLVPHRYVSINFIDATGADPAPALAALSRALGVVSPSDVPMPTRHAHRVPRPAARVPTFLVGREREQVTLRTQLDHLMQGHGSLLLIGGEAGIGKTTLTEWLEAEAEARGAVVLAGGCYDLTTTPPYGPWVEIIRSWPEDSVLPPVPDALRGGESMGRLQSQAALFELTADLLATAGTVKPLVLVLEDLHWADQPSLDLLRYVGHLVSGFRIMVVATYRNDELTRRHPLSQLLPTLARDRGAERLSLPRLGQPAIGAIVDSRYDFDSVDRERLAAYVQQATEGNPFFASETLRSLEEAGVMRKGEDGWRIGELGRIAVPDLVRQVIEARLQRLGNDTNWLLQVASVIGHEIPIDLWIEVSGEDERALAEALDRATEAGITEESARGDGFRFTHALIRETLYESLGPLRRRSLHRRTGEALATTGNPDPDAVAHHFQRAGDERALEWLIQAAARANRSYAWLIAAERYEQAAEIASANPQLRREQSFLLLTGAMMRRYVDPELAVRYLEDAARIGREAGDPWLATFPRALAGYYRFLSGQMRAGVDQMVAVGPEVESIYRDGRMARWEPPRVVDPAEWPAFDMVRTLTLQAAAKHPDLPVVSGQGLAAQHLAGTGRFREARELAEPLAVVWPPNAFSPDTAEYMALAEYGFPSIYEALASIAITMGQPRQALEFAETALAAYEAIGHHFAVGQCRDLITRALIAYDTEAIDHRRRSTVAAAEAISRAAGILPSTALPHLARLALALLEGGWQPIFVALRDELAGSGLSSSLSTGRQLAAAGVATIAIRMGEHDEARQVIDMVMRDEVRTEPGDVDYQSAMELQLAAIALGLVERKPDEARAWLECYDRWLAWSGAVLGQVEGLLGWGRYYRESGDLNTAEERAQTALAKATDPRQPLGLIAANRLLGELATQRGDYDTALNHLQESVSLAERCEAPYEVALTQTALAELHIAAGDTDTAHELLAAARATCERLGAIPALERINTLARMVDSGASE